jgi:hypothetical protein
MRFLRGGAWLVGLLVWVLPALARGEASTKAEIRRHTEAAAQLLTNKAFGEAIAELNQAYDLGHDYTLLFEIGQAYMAIDQPVFAAKTLKKYLSEGGKRVPTAQRKQVEADIAKQEGQIATVYIHATVEGALVKVDGVDVGKTPLPNKLELPAGSHLLSAAALGCRPWEQRATLPGGEQRDIEIQFETAPPATASAGTTTPVAPLAAPAASGAEASPASSPAPAGTVIAPAPAPAAPMSKTRLAAYIVGGVGAAGLIIGGVYGARAISKRHDSDAACPQNQCSQAGVDLNEQAKSAAHVADVGIGLGLVAAAVATYLFLSEPAATAAPPASAKGARLVADVGPGLAGLRLGGTW